jgi:hypothetical protein
MFNSRYEMYSQALSAKAYSDSNNFMLDNYDGEEDALVLQAENNSVRHSNNIVLNHSFSEQVA